MVFFFSLNLTAGFQLVSAEEPCALALNKQNKNSLNY